jgi:hypothetical protein
MNESDGEHKLRAALRRFRPKPIPRPEVIDLAPTNAFEAVALERLEYLEQSVARLESRVNWLLVMVCGASLSFILKTVFS